MENKHLIRAGTPAAAPPKKRSAAGKLVPCRRQTPEERAARDAAIVELFLAGNTVSEISQQTGWSVHVAEQVVRRAKGDGRIKVRERGRHRAEAVREARERLAAAESEERKRVLSDAEAAAHREKVRKMVEAVEAALRPHAGLTEALGVVNWANKLRRKHLLGRKGDAK